MSQLPMSANLKNNKGDRQSRNERHTFVLVHGGWCGGWVWGYVAPPLPETGDVVTTPTLSRPGGRRPLEKKTATLLAQNVKIFAPIVEEWCLGVNIVTQSSRGLVGS